MDISIRRQATCRKVMKIFIEHGPISRADIARYCALSKQASSEAVSLLEAMGIIEAGLHAQGAVGRRPLEYHIAAGAGFALAFDIGGTKITGVLIDLAGKVVAWKTIATAIQGGLVILDQIVDLSAQLFDESLCDQKKLGALVLGVPGVPDDATGQVKLASNIKNWEGVNLKAALESAFPGCRILFENDVNLAAIGEMQAKDAEAGTTFGFLNVGTGISLGIVLDGKTVSGAGGAAGEIGFLPIVPAGEPASPTKLLQLEQEIGSYGLVRRHNTRAPNPVANVREIFLSAADGDEHAQRTIEDVGYYLAVAIQCAESCLNLVHYVLGGSIGMQPALAKSIRSNLDKVGRTDIQLSGSRLDNQAGICGAAYLSLQTLVDGLFHYTSSGDPIPSFAFDPEDFGTSS